MHNMLFGGTVQLYKLLYNLIQTKSLSFQVSVNQSVDLFTVKVSQCDLSPNWSGELNIQWTNIETFSAMSIQY